MCVYILFIYLFIYSFIYLFIYLLIYPEMLRDRNMKALVHISNSSIEPGHECSYHLMINFGYQL